MQYYSATEYERISTAYQSINSHKPQQIDALRPTSVGDFTETCTTKCFTGEKYYGLVQQN